MTRYKGVSIIVGQIQDLLSRADKITEKRKKSERTSPNSQSTRKWLTKVISKDN